MPRTVLTPRSPLGSGGPKNLEFIIFRKDCCGVCKTAIFREILVHNEDKKRNIIDLRKMEAPVPCKCFF